MRFIVILLFSICTVFAGSIRILIDENLSKNAKEPFLQEIIRNFEIYRIPVEVIFEDLKGFYENYINQGDKFIETYMIKNEIDILNFVIDEGNRALVFTFTEPHKDFVSETCYIIKSIPRDDILRKSVVSCILRNMYNLGRLKVESREL